MSTPPPGGWCGPGRTMCCICFACRDNITELHTDAEGQKWDVCADRVSTEGCAEQAGLVPPRERPFPWL